MSNPLPTLRSPACKYHTKFQASLLDPRTFSVTWELVPGRGSFERSQEIVLESANAVAKGGKVHALTITDNPGGNPAISSEMLSAELASLGVESLVHFACKDKNRNQLEGLLYGLEREGVRNLLALTGDYTSGGYLGRSGPVFDLDSCHLLDLIGALNRGLEVRTRNRSTMMKPTHFCAGAAVSPFKALEAEQVTQYFKLLKKLQRGAQFIVSQLGFDARKMHEALLMMRTLGFGHVPLVGNIYVLSLGAARMMNRNGLAGCVVTDELVRVLEKEAGTSVAAKDKRLERAAKMYALMKGMGFAGVHIGGHGMTHQDLSVVLEKGEALTPSWQEYIREFDMPQPNGWYFFDKDEETGLNTEDPADRTKTPASGGLGYALFRLTHRMMFREKGLFFRPMRSFARKVDGSRCEHSFTRLEQVMKGISNECMHCGDCGRAELAYLCRMSQSPTGQRNGPCGGSFEGYCEVYPEQKQCIHVRAYNRLKSKGEEDTLAALHLPPVNHDLRWTSSWINFYMERDQCATRRAKEAVLQVGNHDDGPACHHCDPRPCDLGPEEACSAEERHPCGDKSKS